VTFVQLGRDARPPFEQITSVAVVPYLPDGRLVAALLDRGPDLPGGHVREDERTVEETARREALEEAGVTLSDLYVVQVVQSDYFGTDPQDLTYLVVLTGRIEALEPFQPAYESSGRALLEVEKFLDQYVAGDRAAMRHTVLAAQDALRIEEGRSATGQTEPGPGE
jgi:8-oxo-dGTP pyrophosphatase MutT (NUDIX family)